AWAYGNNLIEKPVNLGSDFKAPSTSLWRKARAASGVRMFRPDQIRRLLELANDPETRAMILLGINAGYGPSDLATLRTESIDLDGGWIDQLRTKTGAPRC